MPSKSMDKVLQGVDNSFKELVRDDATGKLREQTMQEKAANDAVIAAQHKKVYDNLQNQYNLDSLVMPKKALEEKYKGIFP